MIGMSKKDLCTSDLNLFNYYYDPNFSYKN